MCRPFLFSPSSSTQPRFIAEAPFMAGTRSCRMFRARSQFELPSWRVFTKSPVVAMVREPRLGKAPTAAARPHRGRRAHCIGAGRQQEPSITAAERQEH